jgi:hypothetical protein
VAVVISDIIIESATQELSSLNAHLGTVIILNEENELDPSTPVKLPMKIGGMGVNGEHITYPIEGWDKISTTEDDPYMVVSNDGEKWHVVRTSINHTVFFAADSLSRVIDDIAYDAEDKILSSLEDDRY